MTIFDSIKNIARGANELLKKTKVISTLAPIVGAATGRAGLGAAIGSAASAAGYQKGGRILKKAKGGKVSAPKKSKAPKMKKAKAKHAKKHHAM